MQETFDEAVRMPPVHNAIRQVSHASVDFLGELKVSALLGLLEQTAVEASAEAGWDPARYAAEKRVWIVRRTRLERLVPLGGGDHLRIATHVDDFRRARSIRRYAVERTARFRETTDTSRHAARATTDWVYCDAASGRPVTVTDEMKSALFGEAAPVLARAPRVELPVAEPRSRLRLPVRPSHLDHMGHVNNAVWADFLEDGAFELFAEAGFGLDRMLRAEGALRVRRLDLEYLAEARVGQDLCILSWLEALERSTDRDAPARARLVQAIDDGDGKRLVRAASEWVWRSRAEILGGAPSE
ncbi:MAG: hypothetical protein FJ144_10050 [Deltaproteobacteria bacterium]|nr:hypothetical protein [Deltaproteobacteria bacterium]